jgi:hypothetical protein
MMAGNRFLLLSTTTSSDGLVVGDGGHKWDRRCCWHQSKQNLYFRKSWNWAPGGSIFQPSSRGGLNCRTQNPKNYISSIFVDFLVVLLVGFFNLYSLLL